MGAACMSLLDAFDIVIGIDTEYVSGENRDGVPKDENAVFSYQVYYFHPATGRSNGGYYTTGGTGRRYRHALTSLLARTISGMKKEGIDIHADYMAAISQAIAEAPKRKVSKPRNLKIAIVIHFARADMPTFSDFKSLKKSFDHVRGTFVSIKRPTVRDIRMPNGARVKTTLTLFDTRLLAPAGAGSLKDLGNLIGLPKLTLPKVIDEHGASVRGIARMDLVHAQYLEDFAAYAIRDAEVAVGYLRLFADFAESWGAKKMPPTVASLATLRLRQDAIEHLPGILGRDLTAKGRIGESHAEARELEGLAADAYHGGRNEAYVHGIFTGTPSRPFSDYDVRGCYTTEMSEFRELDWAAVEQTKELRRLAVLEEPSIAAIDIHSPAKRRFPCLPVSTYVGGLVFP